MASLERRVAALEEALAGLLQAASQDETPAPKRRNAAKPKPQSPEE